MLPRNHLHRIRVDFYDPRLAANAGLLPETLSRHLVLGGLVDHRRNPSNAPVPLRARGWPVYSTPGTVLCRFQCMACALVFAPRLRSRVSSIRPLAGCVWESGSCRPLIPSASN